MKGCYTLVNFDSRYIIMIGKWGEHADYFLSLHPQSSSQGGSMDVV